MPQYEQLSKELSERIEYENQTGTFVSYAFSDADVIRRKMDKDTANVWRTAFIRDIDKIMHCPFYNRYADKTQVFSLYKNDDITRRGLHVQLVSRIARTIGKALHLNLDLIEAIALGHDIGHTPFGHAGEKFLDIVSAAETGRHFAHNLQSVRVLDQIFPYNISLQTLNGIASHNGEMELDAYYPKAQTEFSLFDDQIEACIKNPDKIASLIPNTLEGCVVRVSDIIAYLGKDRQDAARTKLRPEDAYSEGAIGTINAEIINNLIVNIIENSYGKPYIKMDTDHFEAVKAAKKENYALIYENDIVKTQMNTIVQPILERLYVHFLKDLQDNRTTSPIFTQHIDYIEKAHYERDVPYAETEPHQIVVDYIASMTDDYMVDLYDYLFPGSHLNIQYRNYFRKKTDF